jgi:hypothetical protein
VPRPACLRTSLSALLVALWAGCAGTARAADLTATEQRWLRGIWPVVAEAREQHWPVDIVVQPQDAPEAAPLALAFVGGRCKVVLSMRGNPEAPATLARIEPELLDGALALMAAHEIHGHCRRHLDGAWRSVPAGFVAPVPPALPAELHADLAEMRATRGEEGYADLAGLAWVRQRLPALYPRLYRWLVAERERDLIEGSHHDTRAWLRQAAQPEAEAALRDPALGPALDILWRSVLEQEH